jgi:hypothetical protein
VVPSCEKSGEIGDEVMWCSAVKREEKKRMNRCGVQQMKRERGEKGDEVMWCPAVKREERKGMKRCSAQL